MLSLSKHEGIAVASSFDKLRMRASLRPAARYLDFVVMPAKAGIHLSATLMPRHPWTPAFAGVTIRALAES